MKIDCRDLLCVVCVAALLLGVGEQPAQPDARVAASKAESERRLAALIDEGLLSPQEPQPWRKDSNGRMSGLDDLDRLLSETCQRDVGASELDSARRSAFARLIKSHRDTTRRYYEAGLLGDSAVEYLKSDGWKVCQVLGTVTARNPTYRDDFPRTYLVIRNNYADFYVDNFINIKPGKYLGQVNEASAKIIDSFGTERRLFVHFSK